MATGKLYNLKFMISFQRFNLFGGNSKFPSHHLRNWRVIFQTISEEDQMKKEEKWF